MWAWEWVLLTMESAPNPFSSLLLYQKVMKSPPGFLAETLVCYDTTQRKVHLGLFTRCDTQKAIYPPPGAFTLGFSLRVLRTINWKAKRKEENINTVHLICCSLSAEIKGTILPVSLKVDLSVFFLFFCTGSSRKHSASHWCLQNIAQESVDSSDEEFFDARG